MKKNAFFLDKKVVILFFNMTDKRYLRNNIKFRFLALENVGIDAMIKFLSPLIAEIRGIYILHGGHFGKWPPWPSQEESGWGPVLK